MFLVDYVWYACYGSNLLETRFHCYIGGGKAEGSTKSEIGCTNPTLPIKVSPIIMPYEMYFAEYSGRWDGGVAFIDTKKKENIKTFGKKYLITAEQFQEIVQQENGDSSMIVDLPLAKKVKMYQFSNGWYGNIIYLGEKEGHPIFTFTDHRSIDEKTFTSPSMAYLKSIFNGMRDTYDDEPHEFLKYLYNCKGVSDTYSLSDLERNLL